MSCLLIFTIYRLIPNVAATIVQKDGVDPTLHGAEALSETSSPLQSPVLTPTRPESKSTGVNPPRAGSGVHGKRGRTIDEQALENKLTPKKKSFAKPYYGIIVDGCHSHPHSVRVSDAYPEGS